MRYGYDPTRFTYTEHARQRMRQWRIDATTVTDTLTEGYVEARDNHHVRLRHPATGIRVIADTTTHTIITVLAPVVTQAARQHGVSYRDGCSAGRVAVQHHRTLIAGRHVAHISVHP